MRQRAGTPSVLVVEDDRAIRRLIETVLKEVGCDVIAAEHGAEQLERLDDHDADVVILDLAMPVMNGVEFYQELQRRGRTLPTILMSSTPDAPAIARELGVPVCIRKPLDDDTLTRAVYDLYEEALG
jgi:CheY-like chemotaxis protein